MSGGPARPSAADSKFASLSPPPFQELATGPVAQTGPQRQPGVGVGARVCGLRDSFNRLAIGTSGVSSTLSPHPPLDPLPGREGEILASRTFDSPHSASRVSSSPLVQIEGTSLQALAVTPAPEPESRFFLLGPRGGDRLHSGSARDHPETRTKVSGTPARGRGDEKGIANAKYGAVPLEAIRFRLNRIAFSYSLVCRDVRASR